MHSTLLLTVFLAAGAFALPNLKDLEARQVSSQACRRNCPTPTRTSSRFVPTTTSSRAASASTTPSATLVGTPTSVAASSTRPASSSAVSSSAAPAPSSSAAAGSIERLSLDSHNKVRAMHGAVPLTWNTTLVNFAQTVANKCIFEHSNGPWGENLAAATGNSMIDFGIKLWADEAPEYDPNNPVASHFTQMVWKATTKVGCAEAPCDGIFDARFGKAKFWVCEYSPPGNVYPAANFRINVQP